MKNIYLKLTEINHTGKRQTMSQSEGYSMYSQKLFIKLRVMRMIL